MALKPRPLTMHEVGAIVVDKGLTGRTAVAVLATIWGESSGDAHAVNGPIVKDDPEHIAHLSLDRGLAQWNSGYWPEVTDRRAFDPVVAVGLMVDHILAADSPADGLRLWVAFKSLAFLDHVPAATAVIEELT